MERRSKDEIYNDIAGYLSRPPEFILVAMRGSGVYSLMNNLCHLGLKNIRFDDLDVPLTLNKLEYFKKNHLIQTKNAPYFLTIDNIVHQSTVPKRGLLYKMNFSAPVVVLTRDPVAMVKSGINRCKYIIDRPLFKFIFSEPDVESYFDIRFDEKGRFRRFIDVITRWWRVASMMESIEHLSSPEKIFIETNDISPSNIMSTLVTISKRFSLNTPDYLESFGHSYTSPMAHVLRTEALYIYPRRNGLDINNPIIARMHIDGVSELAAYIPNRPLHDELRLPVIAEFGQNIIQSAGNAKLYLLSENVLDYEKIKNNDKFHSILRAQAMEYLERLAEYGKWCDRAITTECDVLDYFNKNRVIRERFLMKVGPELELVYRDAPHITETWESYNELRKG
jgi:hypothetical protein